ncbi:MAG: FtsX-like permease family protein [Bacteroidia bacterium]
MNFPVYIAKRYIVSKKSNNAINIISWISVLAIAMGAGALVIVLSGMNGLTNLVEGLYSSFDSDIEITAAKGKVINYDKALKAKISRIKGVNAIAVSIEDNALLKYGDQQTIATVKGIGEDFVKMNRFDTLVYEGKFQQPQGNTHYVVLGKGVAYRLGTGLNDVFTPISIYSPKRGKTSSFNPDEAFNEIKAYPSGLFSINDEFDFKYVMLDLEAARSLFDYTNEVTSIELACSQSIPLETMQAELKKELGDHFIIKNKFQQNDVLFKTLQSEKLWTFIILVFILMIATFNIIGALTMLIIEKKKDISILHNMGADASLIRKIFMTEGFLITILGAIIGLLLGLLLCWLQLRYGFIRFDAGYVVEAYPVDVQFSDFAAILGVVLLIGLLAAWYPVRVFTGKSLNLGLKD